MFRHFGEKFRGGPLARISFSSSMWTTDHTANYSQTAEYVLEESRRKKVGEEKQNPGMQPSLCCILVVEASGSSSTEINM